ncbi:hypothetical protein Scep_005994 [Stephania cephalantha]|uniref:OCEL domain-containing protein n=1 Tax=Stephania cephalantha TaxID=152367 RepID=A0AAP0K792_9MAGN
MYGNTSGKLGRGGGGGGGRGAKRIHSSFPPHPPPHRTAAPAGRLSIGSRNRHAAAPSTSAAAAPSAREESFGLVSDGDPLAFAMIIRLAPNLVDEIRRVEAEGGTPRIKFDSNANNPSGNVIDVGGKDFSFTWSHEPGDLCDIYEERQSGEDGNGLLVEAGGAWRKLNVQRILDESTKNHVKMRSEEAERKSKSRKAIVLDHGNPSVKNQMKILATAAVETTSGTAPKSSFKIGFPITTSKGRVSISPVTSPPEQLGPSASPIGTGNSTRGQAEEVIVPRVTKKDGVIEATATFGKKRGSETSSMDLQSMLITLLSENPKGMSLKALEKAIGDSIPNCTKKIEPIIKKIANFQAPGRYILRSGVELESVKRPTSESGSSPDYARDQISILGKTAMDEDEQHSPLNLKLEEANQLEKNGIQRDSPEPLCDKKASDHSDGHAGSSSDSGSDSDSDSDSGSDSGSGSGSQSRSPVGSGSGSSSDSESDGSSSNKEEGSDIDVDIVSDDEKEGAKHKLLNLSSKPGFPTSHAPWRNDGQLEQNGFDEDQPDDHVSVGDKTAKDIHDDNVDASMIDITNFAPSNANLRISPDPLPSSFLDYNHMGEHNLLPSAGNSVDERLDKRNGSRLGPSDGSGGLVKPNSTISYDKKGLPQISESAKRMKPGRPTQPPSFVKSKEAVFQESPPYSSNDWPGQDLQSDHNLRTIDRVSNGPLDPSLQGGHGFDMLGKPVMDGRQSGQMIGDLVGRGSASDMVEKTRKYSENSWNAKLPERNSTSMDENGSTLRGALGRERFSTNKDKATKEMQDDDGSVYEKSLTNNVRQLDVGDKLSTPLKSQYRKSEQVGRLKDTADQMANPIMGTNVQEDDRIDVHRSPVTNDKVLRREPSDLELGELREPIQSERASGSKKKFEKWNSFKLSENKSIPSESLNPELSKGRHAGKGVQDSRKKISPDSLGRIPINQEDSFKKRITEDGGEESSLPQRVTLSQSQQLPKLGHGDSLAGTPLNKSAELGGRLRNNEAQRHQVGHEGYPNTHKKAPVTADIDCIIDGKSQKSNTAIDMNGRKKDLNGGPKMRESFSDDESSYSKFEKDEPELKGPIKDMKQYKEYVQEYLEKYNSYCSINRSLETYRNDFSKLGHDLKVAKDGDPGRYLNILDQLKESYHKCGELQLILFIDSTKRYELHCPTVQRHKRLKKIFIVLHEELKHLKQRIKEFAVTYEKD